MDLTSIAGVTSMDQRFVAPPGGSMIIGSSTANATGGNIFERVQLQAGVPYQVIVYENHEIPLPPGSLVRVTGSLFNQGLMVTFQWRGTRVGGFECAWKGWVALSACLSTTTSFV